MQTTSNTLCKRSGFWSFWKFFAFIFCFYWNLMKNSNFAVVGFCCRWYCWSRCNYFWLGCEQTVIHLWRESFATFSGSDSESSLFFLYFLVASIILLLEWISLRRVFIFAWAFTILLSTILNWFLFNGCLTLEYITGNASSFDESLAERWRRKTTSSRSIYEVGFLLPFLRTLLFK